MEEPQTKTIIFMSLAGNELMTLDVKDIKWSSILQIIAMEEWYQTCKRWKFVLGVNNSKSDNVLQSDDVLKSDDKMILITCIQFIPHISFELPTGETLVTIPFDSCKSSIDSFVYLLRACFEAHKELKDSVKDGYGTYITKIHPLLDTYICNGHEIPKKDHPYVFYDKKGTLLKFREKLKEPEHDNLIIVAVQRKVYCYQCQMNANGILHDEEQRNIFNESITVKLCSVCGFLHCSSCGMFNFHKVGTSDCVTTS
jgi:hypothetical protein